MRPPSIVNFERIVLLGLALGVLSSFLTWDDTVAAVSATGMGSGTVIAIQADMFFRQVCGGGYDSGYRAIRAAIAREAAAFGRPVLLIHGDSHVFVQDTPLEGAPNVTRLMVPGETDTQAVVVTLDPAAEKPFRFELVGEPGNPPQRPPCAGYVSSIRSTRSE